MDVVSQTFAAMDEQYSSDTAATVSLDKPPTAWLLACSSLRGLQHSAVLRGLWGAAPFLGLLRHQQSAVRWVAAQACALLFGLVRFVRSTKLEVEVARL